MVRAWLPTDTDGSFSQCKVYLEPFNSSLMEPLNNSLTSDASVVSNSSSVACSRWVYSSDVFTNTLATELNLVCDREFLTTYVNLTTLLGIMIGSIICGGLADVFGRKFVFMIFLCLQLITMLCVFFVDSFISLLCIRFVSIIAGMCVHIACFTWCVELVGIKKRVQAGVMGIGFGWNLGLFVTLLDAYFIRDWKVLSIALAIPNVFLLSYYWLVPESPRWLLNKKRYEDAMKVVKQIAKVNKKRDFDENSITKLVRESKFIDDKTANEDSLKSVMKSRSLLIRLMILSFNWITLSMVYYGISLNLGTIIEGDIFMNFFINAILELIAHSIVFFTLNKSGRKRFYCLSMFIAAIALMSTIIPKLLKTDQLWVSTLLSNIGKLGVTADWAVVYFFTAELFPTSMRNAIVGFCSTVGRFGALVSPYIGNLPLLVDGNLGKVLPLVIFGILALLSGIFSIFLPESNGIRLPDSLVEAKAIKKNNNNLTKL